MTGNGSLNASLQANKGTYYCVFYQKDESGKRKQIWKNLHIPAVKGNKRKAEQAMRELLRDYEDKKIEVYRKDTLFCDYLQVWLDSKVKLEFNTRESYQCTIDAHIYPFFKKLNIGLQDMEYRHIEAYYASKGKTLSATTLKKHHAIIKQTLRKAVQSKLIASNPAVDIELPKVDRFIGSFLSVEQGDALLDAAKGTPMEAPIVLAMVYGLRRSERSAREHTLPRPAALMRQLHVKDGLPHEIYSGLAWSRGYQNFDEHLRTSGYGRQTGRRRPARFHPYAVEY